MKFGKLDRYITGISVPVSALRSGESTGCGEFADLPLLGRWCVKAGIDLIQILPVNDTGQNSSPYSSLSSCALHPLYLRLQDVSGASPYLKEIKNFGSRTGANKRFSYREVLSFKLSVAERIFKDREKEIAQDPGFARWRDANPWVIPYAAFKTFKTLFEEAPWKMWPELRPEDSPPTAKDAWEAHRPLCIYFTWLQYELDSQLSAASRVLERMGVRLKGDIPILMSEESADVWDSPKYFYLSASAGAPPDMYSTTGQNWGFPVYDWDALGADGYSWWKRRLEEASKFFNAFRIDHVLGFFRIWAIPRTEVKATLGTFSPSATISPEMLRDAGFDDGRIAWLSIPHARAKEFESLGTYAPRISEIYFDRVDNEVFRFKPSLDGERKILELNDPPTVKDFLASKHRDRALIPLPSGEFHAAWYFWQSTSFKGLDPDEQGRLRGLFDAARKASEEIWEARGRELLSMLRDTTDMLVCAEDLGDVPECVPRVLSDLGILGLRVQRWAREYDKPGAPFIPPAHYPRLTVCTASVHDTSTLRGWWEESPSEREAFFGTLGLSGARPPVMSQEILLKTIELLFGAGSLICVLQLQDALDLDRENWSQDPREDRVNVPGTLSESNWSWRMPFGLEELLERREPAETIGKLAHARRGRALK
jgi:4-alpha-glucanotransferase